MDKLKRYFKLLGFTLQVVIFTVVIYIGLIDANFEPPVSIFLGGLLVMAVLAGAYFLGGRFLQ